MKTKEFIKRVKELGYKIIETSLYIFVDKNGAALAMISKEQQYKIETFNILSEACGDELFSICYEYARTPIDERGEEQKFYLQKIETFYDEFYHKVIKNNNFKWDEILSSQYHYAGNDLYLFKGAQDNIYFIKADSPENAYKAWASNAIGLVGNMLIDALLEE